MTTHFRIEMSIEVAITEPNKIADEIRWFDQQVVTRNKNRKKNKLELKITPVTRGLRYAAPKTKPKRKEDKKLPLVRKKARRKVMPA